MAGIFPDGTTLTLAYTGGPFSAVVFQQGGVRRSVVNRDCTPLAQRTGTRLKAFGQKVEHESVSIQYYFDPSNDLVPLGIPVTFTAAYPDGIRILTGKGALVSDDTGDLVQDDLVQGTCEFMFKGGTASGDFPLISGP